METAASREIRPLDWPSFFRSAFAYGLGLCAVLSIVLFGVGTLAQDMFVDDYPPQIRDKHGPPSRSRARLRPFVGILFFLPPILVPLVGLSASQSSQGQITFLPALAFAGVVLVVFNTYDLLILDWLLFCTIQPRFMVLPGTEGMAAYRDYRFHLMGFFKGLGFCAVGSLVVASLWLILGYASAG